MTVTTIRIGRADVILEDLTSGFTRMSVSEGGKRASVELRDVDIRAVATALRTHNGSRRRKDTIEHSGTLVMPDGDAIEQEAPADAHE
jgi:hypothetical protein